MQILEYIHVNVDSIAKTARFMVVAVPDYPMRGGGDAEGFGPWAHLGDESSYMALTEVRDSKVPAEIRHIGIVVDDVNALMERLAKAGFEPTDLSALNEHPSRKRVYYTDGNGLDWEFVQYLVETAAERNDYSQ